MSANKSGLINAQEEIGYWEKLENRYRDLYSSQVQENNSRAAQQTEKTLRQIGEQIDALNLQFKESNQALYRGFRAAQRKLPQQLAAAGITGGLSESSQVKLQSDYLSEMGKSNQEHTKAEQALRTKGLEAQGDYYAQAERENQSAKADYTQRQITMEKEKRNAREKEAADMANTGDFSLYASLGYSQEEINAMRSAWEEKNPKLAMSLMAKTKAYNAKEVASLSPALAQYYLQALGYKLKNNGIWDSATEKAYRAVFGKKSGRK